MACHDQHHVQLDIKLNEDLSSTASYTVYQIKHWTVAHVPWFSTMDSFTVYQIKNWTVHTCHDSGPWTVTRSSWFIRFDKFLIKCLRLLNRVSQFSTMDSNKKFLIQCHGQLQKFIVLHCVLVAAWINFTSCVPIWLNSIKAPRVKE